jgi:hypothetical protein
MPKTPLLIDIKQSIRLFNNKNSYLPGKIDP